MTTELPLPELPAHVGEESHGPSQSPVRLFDSDQMQAYARAAIAADRAQRVGLTEAQIVACLVEAGCCGTVKMSFESGPYDITRTSINADKFARAIEAAHGITPSAPTQTPPATAQTEALRCDGCGKTMAGHDQMARCQPTNEQELRARFDKWSASAPAFAPEFEQHKAWAEQFAWFTVRELFAVRETAADTPKEPKA